MGVWIETEQGQFAYQAGQSHTLRGCVDWNWVIAALAVLDLSSHTLRGCVDWNININYTRPAANSHTLRGCVDWNLKLTVKRNSALSHTLRGCVDWNNTFVFLESQREVTPCVGVWIETTPRLRGRRPIQRHTLRGCVDWNHLLVR